ncbi:MAG: tetratricopeptide repeat protein [Oligoflexus sp.]
MKQKWMLLATLLHLPLLAEEKPQDFIDITKITVGPYDNFESYVSQDEKYLYYSQSQYMSSHIRRFDLSSGLSSPLLDLDADSKSPRISPDGKLVAFTYFREDAKGDVCLTPTEDLDIQCISRKNIADHSAFWLNEQTIAYLSSNDRGDRSELIAYDLQKKTQEKLLEGAIFSPNISSDRRRLVYRSGDEQIVIYDLNSKKIERQFRIGVPGITGLAHFSADGRHLYFTQYLLDSNRDLKIDGRDQGAIFRIDLKQQGQSLMPEQLSSTDQNCSYPFPTSNALYVTCAFEGSLDIYRMPLEGTIPSSWTKDDVWEAHLRVRSYADRLLLVNRLLSSYQAISEIEYLQRSFHNLILMKEWLAVYHFGKLAQERVPAAQKPIYQGLVMIASSMARWETLPNQRITAEFSRFIEEQRSIVGRQLNGDQAISSLVDAYFASMLNQKNQAKAALKRPPNDMMLLFLHTDLWLRLYPEADQQRQRLLSLIKNQELPFQTRIYYLSALLEVTGKLAKPQQALQSMAKEFTNDKPIQMLIENEIDLYTLAEIESDKDMVPINQGITKRSRALKEHYFAHRLLFNRNMIMFARFDKITQLSVTASLWLSQIQKNTKEYPYVIEAYRQNTLDMAYSYLHSKEKSRFAKGAFFSNIRMSDDLESHYHFARLNLKPEDWQILENQYQLMLEDNLIRKSSYEFVKLVGKLLQSGASLEAKELDQGIQLCESIPDQQTGVGVKYLMLGYLYQRKFEQSVEGFAFDRSLADKAHRNYLLSLDLSWNNDRIRASSFQNLGVLHLKIRNYSLAAEYFLRRAEIPFENRDEELAFRWNAANSLYKANRFAEALAQIETAIKKQPTNPLAWQERAAFYAMNAKQFAKAVSYYQQFYRNGSDTQKNRGGIALAYAYSLDQHKQNQEALQWYQRALDDSSKESPAKAVKGSVQYHPRKTQFIAYGLLSQMNIPASERTKYLKARLQLYGPLKKDPAAFQFNDVDLIAQELKDQQRLALLYLEQNQKDAASQAMAKSLELAAEDGKSLGFISQAVQQSFKNAIFHFVWTHPQGLSPAVMKPAKAIMDGMEDEAKDNQRPSPQFVQLLTESRFFFAALEAQAGGNRRSQFEQKAQLALQHELFQGLKDSAPELQKSLQAYQAAMTKAL